MKTLALILGSTVVLSSGLLAGEINSDQLIDAYITYTEKAVSSKKDEPVEFTEDERKRMVASIGKEHPLFVPYEFDGMTLNREALIKGINKNIRDCQPSNDSSAKIPAFATMPDNLDSLSDAELVLVSRITEELIRLTEQQSEALDFVKECVRQVKRKDQSVFEKVTDINTLWDVRAEVRERYGENIEWDEMFGRLSELSDDQIAQLFTTVLTLKRPGSVSLQTLTDKRKTKERTVKGTYIRFKATIAPEFRHVFRNEKDVGFGVYLIEGEKYWEPFGW